jgi:outer membrane lipoprotein-sorting protein
MRKSLSAVAFVAAVFFAAAGSAAAQTLDEILAKHLEAKGGEKWKATQSMRITARIVTQGIELPMTMVTKRPNLMRQDMTYQGVSIVQAFDGTTAWAINPMQGSSEPQETTGPMADSLRDQADFDGGLIDYKAKGSALELVGLEDLDGKKVHHLKLTTKSKQVQHYYLDAATGLESKLVVEADMGGGPMTIETVLSNFQTINGISVPMSLRQTGPTGDVAITVEKVEFDVALDDAIFKMPVK